MDQQAQLVPYAALIATSDSPQHGQQNLQIRNGFLPRMTPEIATAITRMTAEPQTVQIELRSVGGAIADRAQNATAFAHWGAQFFLSLWGQAWPSRSPRRRLDARFHVHDRELCRLPDRYPPGAHHRDVPQSTLARLKEITSRYDPTGVFGRI